MPQDNLASDIDLALQLAKGHTWILWATAIAWILVRISKDDRAVKWLPLFIAPRWRAWAALIIATLYGVLHKLAAGGSWGEAIVGGLVAGNSATLGHEFLIESLRQGRDIGVSKEDAPPPPPPQAPISMKPPPGLVGMVLILGLLFLGCVPQQPPGQCLLDCLQRRARAGDESAILMLNGQLCREKAVDAIRIGGSCEEKRERVHEVTSTDPVCLALYADAGLVLHCKDGGDDD